MSERSPNPASRRPEGTVPSLEPGLRRCEPAKILEGPFALERTPGQNFRTLRKFMRMPRGVLGALSVVALWSIIEAPARAQTWVLVPGALSEVSVGNSITIWGVNSSNNIYEYSNASSWIKLPGQLTYVTVAPDGVAWGINSSTQQVWEYQSSTNTWNHIQGNRTSIKVGSRDVVWTLDSTGKVFRFNPAIQAWDHITG